jgi:hypothetical protein
MGGDLSVESTLGRGSCFKIRVPFRLAGASDRELQQESAAAPAPACEQFPRSAVLVEA